MTTQPRRHDKAQQTHMTSSLSFLIGGGVAFSNQASPGTLGVPFQQWKQEEIVNLKMFTISGHGEMSRVGPHAAASRGNDNI